MWRCPIKSEKNCLEPCMMIVACMLAFTVAGYEIHTHISTHICTYWNKWLFPEVLKICFPQDIWYLLFDNQLYVQSYNNNAKQALELAEIGNSHAARNCCKPRWRDTLSLFLSFLVYLKNTREQAFSNSWGCCRNNTRWKI